MAYARASGLLHAPTNHPKPSGRGGLPGRVGGRRWCWVTGLGSMCIHPAGKLVVQVLGCWCKHDHETHLRKTRTAHRTAWGRTGCCTRGRTSHSCLLAAALMRRRRDCRVGCARALSGLPNQLIFCVTSARGLPYLLFVSNKWPLRPWSPRPKQPRDITRRNWWSPANTWVNTDQYK